ncbi:MAG TPA: type II secretion system protein [Sedimentisphaerales bacterium]|nr:type II secretion system protein [Sedimentisphaerales bacterium]
MSKQEQGFTLVELLVVIAIISLLMAILMPSLSRAKDQAQTIVCRSDLKNLALGWTMYVDDNEGNLVEGETGWVKNPMGSASDFITREKEGIKKGDLFQYINDTGVYHCPADRAMKDHANETTGAKPLFRSYTIPGGMNGRHNNYLPPGVEVKKFMDIKAPATKYIFVEEDHVGRDNGNWGSWLLNPKGKSWWDGMAVLHHKKACLGFADGHAEIHTWVDKSTIIEMGEKHLQNVTPAADEGEDLKYMQDHYELKVYPTN